MTLLDFLPSLHRAATPRIDPAIWPLTATVNELGRLCVGDVPLTEIADEFRTPAYVLDETDFRNRLRRYRTTLRDVEIVYAAKSLLTIDVARWVGEEGAGLDVSSGGELAIALAAGVDPARIVMHGNAKTVDELRDAAEVGVGRVVVDSLMEIAHLACEVRRTQAAMHSSIWPSCPTSSTTRWTGRARPNGSHGRVSWSNPDEPSAPGPG